ncbi:MAG: GNAT family N-acetyltransferase, partial [Chloroflexota bacterium]
MTRLEPMTQARYETWLEGSIRGYADEKVASGNYPDDGSSLERARAEFDQLLPNGLQSEGHEIRRMVDDEGNDVGHVWFTQED